MNRDSLLNDPRLAQGLDAAAARYASPLLGSAGRKILWGLAGLGLVLWSLLALGAHALIAGGSEFLLANAHWFGDLAGLRPWLESGIGLTETVGVAVTWIVWGFGAILILLGAWLLPKLLGGARGLLTR